MATLLKDRKPHTSNGTNRIALPAKQLVVPALEVGECEIEIVGNGPLLVHMFSEKARKMVERKQQEGTSVPREKRKPEDDFFGSMYILSGDPQKDKPLTPSSKCQAEHGVPAAGFKHLMVRAAKAAGAKMTDTMTGFFINGTDGSHLVKIEFGRVEMHTAMVRLESGVADVRYRAEYHGWRCVLQIEFDYKVMPLAQLVNLLRRGGMFVGWGEDRPEKGGMHGRFKVGKVVDLGSHSE